MSEEGGGRKLLFAGVMLGLSLAALDLMVVATALPAISGELGDLSQIAWVFTAYMLIATVGMPIWGKLGDLYGRRRVFEIAILIFMAASVLAGSSQTMAQLIIARGLQGLGGGALMSLPHSIISDVVPPRMRGRYMVVTSSVWALASLAGPLLGGFFVDGPGWRWIFYVNLPLGLAALVSIALGFHIPQRRVAHHIDYLGAALFVSGAGALLLAVSWGGNAYPWTSPRIVCLLLASAALLTAFYFQERRAREPVLPLHMFGIRLVRSATAANFLFGLASFALSMFVPVLVIVVGERSATVAGLTLMPVSLGLFCTSVAAGRLIARTGQYRRFPAFGMAIFAAGLLLLVKSDARTDLVTLWFACFTAGAGMGMVNPVILIALQNAVEHRDLGVASAVSSFSRQIAATISTALLGSVMAQRLAHHLAALTTPATRGRFDLEHLRSSPEVIRGLAQPLHDQVTEAFRMAISDTLGVMLVLAGLSFLAALRIEHVPLRETIHERVATDRV